MTQAFVRLELYQAAQSRIATLEAALNEAAGNIIIHGAGYFKERELAKKYLAIAKGEKHET